MEIELRLLEFCSGEAKKNNNTFGELQGGKWDILGSLGENVMHLNDGPVFHSISKRVTEITFKLNIQLLII